MDIVRQELRRNSHFCDCATDIARGAKSAQSYGTLHVQKRSSPRELGGTYEESGVVYTALAHPVGLEEATLVAFVLSSVALVGVVIARARRGEAMPGRDRASSGARRCRSR